MQNVLATHSANNVMKDIMLIKEGAIKTIALLLLLSACLALLANVTVLFP